MSRKPVWKNEWKFVYIHGFNGSPHGASPAGLGKALRTPVSALSYDYSKPYRECLEDLEKQIAELEFGPGQKLCILGSSLGGFYALQIRRAPCARVIVWNPVIYPAVQLARFLGENTRFVDGHKWTFTPDALYSYAEAPDPRQWNNLYGESLARQGLVLAEEPFRGVALGEQDELLDWQLAHSYWDGYAKVSIIKAGHSMNEYSSVLRFME